MGKQAANRKTEHLALTFNAQTDKNSVDDRFLYEPLLGNINDVDTSMDFAGYHFDAPLWVSSMTGGTEMAATINKNLAKACYKFGMGMGLGSCRQLLDSDEYFDDFNVRPYMGDRPLYANLGIAQVEQLVLSDKTSKIKTLINKLQADGLIIHVNPLQEFIQPEGDILQHRAIDIISSLLDKTDIDIIVKEVGQGMGINSLKALMYLPLRAIEFAAFGGTNFSKLELLRNKNEYSKQFDAFFNIGHTAEEMVQFVNTIATENTEKPLCDNFIISGGIKSFLDGYYLTEKINFTAIYGMASALLQPAMKSYDDLEMFLNKHIQGLKMAKAYLRIKK